MTSPKAVLLVPATKESIRRRLDHFVEHYVSDLEQQGLGETSQLVRFSTAMLLGECGDEELPEHSHFFDIQDCSDGAVVGYLWTSGNNFGFGTMLYVKHLLIDPDFRRKGYATAALSTLRDITRECRAVTGISLAVMPSNDAACALYRKLGFTTFSRMMFLRTLPEGALQT